MDIEGDAWIRATVDDATGRIRYAHTDYDELVWEGTKDEAQAIVADKLHDPFYWQFCHHPGQEPLLRFEHEEEIGWSGGP